MYRAVSPNDDVRLTKVLAEMAQRFPKWDQGLSHTDLGNLHGDLSACLACMRASTESQSPVRLSNYLNWLWRVLCNRSVREEHIRELLSLLQECILGKQLESEFVPTMPPETSFLPRLPFTGLLLAGDWAGARRAVLDAIHGGASLADVSVELIQPAMYEIGRLWELNLISFEREHLATAVCQSVLAYAFGSVDLAPPKDQRAILACVPGNFHVLGLRMIADSFEVAGWSVNSLGADVSEARLMASIAQEQPQVVGLSVALPEQLAPTRQLISRLRSHLSEACPRILVGGYAVIEAGTSRELGADEFAPDAKSILSLV